MRCEYARLVVGASDPFGENDAAFGVVAPKVTLVMKMGVDGGVVTSQDAVLEAKPAMVWAVEKLNELGASGWEITNVLLMGSATVYTLRREL